MRKIRMLCIMLLTVSLFAGCVRAQTPEPTQTEPAENPLSGAQIMDAMQLGWNLGNSFDAPEGELAWGNPFTTPELIARVKELGFSTIRIPVSWGKHVSAAPEYTIDETFMTRVDTVVNQALEAGLYVMIDVHHDNGIYYPDPENEEQGRAYLSAVWTQIGTHFRDADYHLIFQTMNEPRIEGTSYEWGLSNTKKSHQEIYQTVNALNQAALDAIRATGGKNADRYVVISPYAGKTASATAAWFRLPQDSAEDKLIVSVHIYSPYNLALNWDKKYSNWSDNDEKEIRGCFEQLEFSFLKKGIPVVVDEMGCTNKGNPEARGQWAKAFMSIAGEYGVPCIWWDNGYLNSNQDNFAMINRSTLEIYPESQSVYDGLFGKE